MSIATSFGSVGEGRYAAKQLRWTLVVWLYTVVTTSQFCEVVTSFYKTNALTVIQREHKAKGYNESSSLCFNEFNEAK